MKVLKLTLTFLALLISAGSFAQSLSNADLKAQSLKDWERAKAYTKEYLDAMPEKGMSFKPTPEVRTFAEQMLHLAQANVMFTANGTGVKPIFADKNLEKSDELKTKAVLTKTVMESYDFAINSIKNMDESKLTNKVTMESFKLTASQFEWLIKGFEHQTHHRGQCTVYLRLMGVTPPPEKLF
ncbi:damage-inducible protein DinB [Flavihumibacter sp. R14]|nr:damage-inducible protein DinB [Flavihumibacter soli]